MDVDGACTLNQVVSEAEAEAPCPVALQDPHLGVHAPGGAVGEGMRGDMVLTWVR